MCVATRLHCGRAGGRMTCRKTWVREGGEKFSTTVTAEANVLTMTAKLLTVNVSDPASSPPSKMYSREQLEAGIDIKVKTDFAYTLDVIVVPRKGTTARVRTQISFDGQEVLNDTCERDESNPV